MENHSFSVPHSKKMLAWSIALGILLVAALVFLISTASVAEEEQDFGANATMDETPASDELVTPPDSPSPPLVEPIVSDPQIQVEELVSPSETVPMETDNTPPVITYFFIAPEYNGTFVNGGAMLTAVVTDAESTIVNCEFNLNNEDWWWPADFTPSASDPKTGTCRAALGLAGHNGESFTFQLRATDSAGNIGVTDTPLTRTVDSANPTASTTLETNYFNKKNFDPKKSIHGTMSDGIGSGVEQVILYIRQSGVNCKKDCEYYWSGTNWVPSFTSVQATLTSLTTWVYNATELQKKLTKANSYSIFAEARDRLNYSGSNRWVSFLWEVAPPVVKIVSPLAGSTTIGPIAVQAETDKNATCGLIVDPQNGELESDDGSTYTPMQKTGKTKHQHTLNNVVPGVHILRVICSDEVQLSGTTDITWTVAAEPPAVVKITTPKAGSTTTGTVDVQAESDKNVTCLVGVDSQALAKMATTGSKKHRSTLPAVSGGLHTLQLECRNGSVVSKASVTWTGFVEPPAVITITTPKVGVMTANSLTVQAQSDKNVTCTLGVDQGNPTKMTQSGGKTHQASLSGMSIGTHTLQLECRNAQNVVSKAATTWNVGETFCGKLQKEYSQFLKGTEGKDTLKGTNGADLILGLGGDDAIQGLNGNDCIIGGAGNNKIDGGAGSDTCQNGSTLTNCEVK